MPCKEKPGGGGELQIALMAKTLAGLGHEVVVVDLDIEEEFTAVLGIKVYPVKGYNEGIRMFRTFTHRLPGLYKTFVGLKADIYYCRIREYRHIIVFMAARKVNAKFILGLASDLDILSIGKRWKHFYSSNVKDLWGVLNGIIGEIVYPVLLRKADCVLVQHESQKEILRKRNIGSIVFPNLIDTYAINTVLLSEKKDFIYVGSLDKRKGFADFFKLVQRSPSLLFKVIGSPRDQTGIHYLKKLRELDNVTLIGRLTHDETIKQIFNSKALISTSPMEGFPNIFIEAWACGVPVLSLHVDPGGVINREGLGLVANGDMDKMIEMMNTVNNSENFAKKAKNYVKNNHELNKAKIMDMNSIFTDTYNGNAKHLDEK